MKKILQLWASISPPNKCEACRVRETWEYFKVWKRHLKRTLPVLLWLYMGFSLTVRIAIVFRRGMGAILKLTRL